MFRLPNTSNRYVWGRFFFLSLYAIVREEKKTNPLHFYRRSFSFLLFFFPYRINGDVRRRLSSVSWSICFAAAVTVRYESCVIQHR